MSSKTEQILQAMYSLLRTIPEATVERNIAVPAKIPAGGLIVLRDGDPGEPDTTLGGFGSAYYSHRVEVEVYVQEADQGARDAAFDDLVMAVGTALEADSTLGGLVFGMSYGRPTSDLEPIDGAPAIKSGVIEITVEYESTAPLA
jgi:hypothetical protein